MEMEAHNERVPEEALQRYSQRMQEARQIINEEGYGYSRKVFPWQTAEAGCGCCEEMALPALASSEAPQDLPAELAHDLGLAGCVVPSKGLKGETAKKRHDQAIGPLRQTFAYAGNLGPFPTFAKFDVRDEICLKVGGFCHGEVVHDISGAEHTAIGVKCDDQGELRLWFQPHDLGRAGAGTFTAASVEILKAKLWRVDPSLRTTTSEFERLRQASVEDFDMAEDLDGQQVMLCHHCHLPLGQTAYAGKGAKAAHGECVAEQMLRAEAKADEKRVKAQAEEKLELRKQYDIGWRPARVPANLGPLGRLGFRELPAGAACCLVLQEATNTVSLAPTAEPAASINLEYLSLALRVRSQDGREPLFSLDPVDATKPNSHQKKMFEPEWLAGTSVGEVMFQADYHLKELSMGEYDQPVLGMKSCFELQNADSKKAWSAREWFVVRKAEIHRSEDNVLIPYIKMGVEARAQEIKEGKLEDCVLTKPNHPLVKYAEAFTHNFDLIAERKSVVYHLRELAKASILAKYLVDSGVRLDSSWFDLAERVTDVGVLEIPQLWNERWKSKVQVNDGKILEAGGPCHSTAHNLYGGIDFGLDRFSAAAPRMGAMGAVAARLGPRSSARVGPGSLRAPSLSFGGTARSVAQSLHGAGVSGPGGSLRAVSGAGPALFSGRTAMAPRLGGFAPRLTGFAPGLQGIAAGLGQPQGVDLNLDKFNLSEPKAVTTQAVAGSWVMDVKSADIAEISKAFWANIGSESCSIFKNEDRHLLREVFNPHMSDRREEGERFMAPDTSMAYVSKLRTLVKEETTMRKRRAEHFFGVEFVMGDAGPLFPSSWTSAYEISCGRTQKKVLVGSAPDGVLQPRPEYVAQAHMFDHVMTKATPVFDMHTEDGIRYRIYRFGRLEVRTTQEHDGNEVVGAAFSIRAPTSLATSGQHIPEDEQIVHITEYVERMVKDPNSFRSYLVLETGAGDVILTEWLENGTASWQVNAKNVEDRNSLAKVVRARELDGEHVITAGGVLYALGQIELALKNEQLAAGSAECQSSCYAVSLYAVASGLEQATTGFRLYGMEQRLRVLDHGVCDKTSASKAAGMKPGFLQRGQAAKKPALEEKPKTVHPSGTKPGAAAAAAAKAGREQ